MATWTKAAAAAAAGLYLALALGPAETLLGNARRGDELRFAHALAWTQLLGVDCRWCEREARRLNAAGPRAPVAATPLPEASVAAAGGRRPVVVRRALPRAPWTAARFAGLEGPRYLFQCGTNGTAALRAGAAFAGYGCGAREEAGRGLARGFYLRQNNRLLADFPELGAEAGLTPAFEAALGAGPVTLRAAGAWDGADAASPARGSSLHADLSANWYAQRAGRKTWTLVAPAESARLLPTFDARPGVPALFSGLGFAAAGGARPLGAFPRYVVTLEPGDLLYVPSWWWHEVENEPGFNAAVALRGPRSVAAAFSPRADALFATLGSAPDVAVVAGRFLRRKLGFEASFEDAFLRAD